MRERIRDWAGRAWQGLLVAAIGALALAAVSTFVGADGFAHAVGTLAWACGFLGAVGGLISGAGREASS